MKLDHLEARLAHILRDDGTDPACLTPIRAWHAVLRLADVAAGIEDLGDDFFDSKRSFPLASSA